MNGLLLKKGSGNLHNHKRVEHQINIKFDLDPSNPVLWTSMKLKPKFKEFLEGVNIENVRPNHGF